MTPSDGPDAPSPGVSVVLPAYNEAKLIARALESLGGHLRERHASWEIVVVDDGSTDATARLVEEARRAQSGIRLVRLERNSGKWGALAAGLREARGAILVTTDADLSYSLPDIDAAVEAVARGAAVATGTRNHPESRINLPFGLFPYLARRWIAGAAFRGAVRLLFGLRVSDTQCGLKAFSREAAGRVLQLVRTRRFLADIEVFLAARGLGLEVAEVPVSLRYLSGASSVGILKDLPGAVADMIRIKAADLRGRYGGR